MAYSQSISSTKENYNRELHNLGVESDCCRIGHKEVYLLVGQRRIRKKSLFLKARQIMTQSRMDPKAWEDPNCLLRKYQGNLVTVHFRSKSRHLHRYLRVMGPTQVK